jgi:quinol monooxygenase YgiN
MRYGIQRALGLSMVQVVLSLVAHPGRRAELVRALRSLMLPLQAAAGFVSSRLYLEADSREALCYVEEWRTSEDLDLQIRSSHYTRLLALMEEAAEPPGLQLNWVTDVKGLEYLRAVRLCER